MSGPRRAASAEDISDHGGVAGHRVIGYGLLLVAGGVPLKVNKTYPFEDRHRPGSRR